MSYISQYILELSVNSCLKKNLKAWIFNVISYSVFLLIVCSTTLWVGQLDKKTQQSDVMSLLEEFGQIESINVSLDNSCQRCL